MYIEVLNFNKKRNNLMWNLELEQDMLGEEIKEFWCANTRAERLDALVDTEFVWIGTQIKACSNRITLEKGLEEHVDVNLRFMRKVLASELGEIFQECYSNACEIVCAANSKKGKQKDDKGKVKKDENVPNATEEIETMIVKVAENFEKSKTTSGKIFSNIDFNSTLFGANNG